MIFKGAKVQRFKGAEMQMFIEARKSKNDLLIEQLDKVPLTRLHLAGVRALTRLQLLMTGRTHEMLLEFGKTAKAEILLKGGEDGKLTNAAAFTLVGDLMRAWGDAWIQWTQDLQQARREAGMIAFGVAAVMHERLISEQWAVISERKAEGGKQKAESGRQAAALEEASVIDGVYDSQLRILLDVAEEYLYGDAINLSGRLWKIEQEARDGINLAILNGIQKGDSAWNIAKELEQFLGAGKNCPRWTSTRLYGRTKTEIADGDVTGLLRGEECNGSGVAYNALRVARTEISKIHALATDRMMAQQPWVELEKVHTSPSHGKTDECDSTASGGDNGDGTYPKGTIELPLHPNCLCYKTAVLMDEADFSKRMSGWLNGTDAWAEMDNYASTIGVPLDTNFMPAALNLAVWLFDDELSSIFGARRLGL